MESVYFLSLLFFIVILIIPINARIKSALNLYDNAAIISVFIWKFKIITIKLFVRDNSIFILTKKKKKEIEISLSIKQIYFVEQLMENIKDKLQIKKVCIYSKIGLIDAHKTAIMCGTILAVCKTFFCYLKNKKPTCSMETGMQSEFNKKVFILCSYFSSSISLFDLLYSLIISLFSLRRKQYERYNKQSKLS